MSPPKAVNPQRWFSTWRRATRPAAGTDPADFGTAFGLEMSMLEAPTEPAATTERRFGWMHRLTGHRRPAT